MFAGEIIRKRWIPKYYVKKFGVNNPYRLKLNRKRRCCYIIAADQEGFKVIVLEVFPDHKSYNRRFGYRKGDISGFSQTLLEASSASDYPLQPILSCLH